MTKIAGAARLLADYTAEPPPNIDAQEAIALAEAFVEAIRCHTQHDRAAESMSDVTLRGRNCAKGANT